MNALNPLPTQVTALAWRVLALLNLFRLLISILLGVIFLFFEPRPVGELVPDLFIGVTTAYLLFAVGAMRGLQHRWPALEVQAVVHIAVDIIVVNALSYASGGMSSGLSSVLILPITAGGLILSLRLSLSLAAAATMGLLLRQVFSMFAGHGDVTSITTAGVLGALMFLLALGGLFAAKYLRESEALLQQREVDIANLAELNDFIVQHLRESILVVDSQDRIRLINESAAQLLKNGYLPPNILLNEVSPRLLYILETWRHDKQDPLTHAQTLVSADGGTLIQPHFVSLEGKQPGPTLIFLEDTSVVATRMQQSKLAALGRLSASIAHEIRNPVGAMSHAAQLLSEAQGLSPQDLRLTEIITSNGERVSTIVDNVLQLSRRDATRQQRVVLNQWVQEFVNQFKESLQLDDDALQLDVPSYDVVVAADASHLHQISWNLCENVFKYGRSPGAQRAVIELKVGRITSSNRPFLEVSDRGPGILEDDVERIFEPFFTAGTGGTGLGLFIARELAHCNGAVLIYEARYGGGSTFRMVFSDPQRWEI